MDSIKTVHLEWINALVMFGSIVIAMRILLYIIAGIGGHMHNVRKGN